MDKADYGTYNVIPPDEKSIYLILCFIDNIFFVPIELELKNKEFTVLSIKLLELKGNSYMHYKIYEMIFLVTFPNCENNYWKLAFKRFLALNAKRFHHFKRSKMLVFCGVSN